MNDRITELEADKNKTANEKDAEIAGLQKDIAEIKRAGGDKDTEIAGLNNRVKELETVKTASDTKIVELNEDNKKIASERDTLKGQNDELTKEVENMTEMLKGEIASKESLETEVVDLRHMIDDGATETEKLNEENKKITSERDNLNVRITEFGDTIERLQGENNALTKQLEGVNAEKERLNETIQAQRVEIEKLNEDNKKIESERDNAISNSTSMIDELNNVRTARTHIGEEKAELTKEVERLRRKVVELEGTTDELIVLREQNAGLLKEVERLGVQIASKESEIGELNRGKNKVFDEAKQEVDRMSLEITSLKEESRVKDTAITNLKEGKMKELEQQNQVLRDEIQKLHTVNEEIRKDLIVASNDKSKLQNDSNEIENKLRAEVIGLRQRIDTVSGDAETLKEQLRASQLVILESQTEKQKAESDVKEVRDAMALEITSLKEAAQMKDAEIADIKRQADYSVLEIQKEAVQMIKKQEEVKQPYNESTEIARLNRELEHLYAKVHGYEKMTTETGDVTQLKSKIVANEKEIASLKIKLSQSDEDLAHSDVLYKGLLAEVQEYEKTLALPATGARKPPPGVHSHLISKIAQLEDEVMTLRKELILQKSTDAYSNEYIRLLIGRLNQMRMLLRGEIEANASTKQSVTNLRKILFKHSDRVNVLTRAVESYVSYTERLQAAYDRMRDTYITLRDGNASIDTTDSAKSRIDIEVNSVKMQIGNLNITKVLSEPIDDTLTADEIADSKMSEKKIIEQDERRLQNTIKDGERRSEDELELFRLEQTRKMEAEVTRMRRPAAPPSQKQ